MKTSEAQKKQRPKNKQTNNRFDIEELVDDTFIELLYDSMGDSFKRSLQKSLGGSLHESLERLLKE